MKTFATLALLTASLIPSTVAHGYVKWVEIAGKRYNGPKPWEGNGNFGIRRITSTSPVHLKDGADLACGKGAATRGAKLTLSANPGDKVVFRWDSGDPNPNWPHNSGPLIDYLGKCDAAGCDKTDGTKVNWFKIGEIGKKPNQGNKWYQEDMQKGWNPSVVLPANLAPGNYLIRHEIIALHLADKKGGAEYYPACIQIKVGGTNTGVATSTVKFPGAYKADDPSLFINIWNNAKKPYKIPGPAIAQLGSSSAKPAAAAAKPAVEPQPNKSTQSTKSESGGCKASPKRVRRNHPRRLPAADLSE